MITLEEAKVGMADKVDQNVIDEFRRGSRLLDLLVFDNAVAPGTGGSTLTYGYQRVKTPATAVFRNINEEYKNSEAIREPKTVDLKIFGGQFKLDRVIANTSGAVDEITFQLEQKIKSAISLFHYTVINGDTGADEKEFDGLDKALVGTTTEVNKDGIIDLSNTEAVDKNYNEFLDALDDFISGLDGRPTALMGNSKLMTKIKSVARRAGYLTHNETAFGTKVSAYDGIELIDLGEHTKDNKEVPVVGINKRTVGEKEETGLTDLYAVRIGIDGFHGVSLTGNDLVKTYLPDMEAPGAVKAGEVELVAAVALKSTKAGGVLRNIKVM